MPGKTDDDQLDEESTEETEDETEETEESTEEESEEGSAEPKSKKRISDLQSKADAAEARANRAEQALAALKRGAGSDGDKTDPATRTLMSELREASLDAIFGEFPEFKEYGIDRTSIEGTTRAELRESAVTLVGLIRSVKTKVRNQVLAENGMKAEPSGSVRTKPVDYASMSEEAFLKLLERTG